MKAQLRWKKDLQLKQLVYVSLSLVYLDYMTFHDVFGSGSSYGAREEREDGQGRFEHCDLLTETIEGKNRPGSSKRYRSECIYWKTEMRK